MDLLDLRAGERQRQLRRLAPCEVRERVRRLVVVGREEH